MQNNKKLEQIVFNCLEEDLWMNKNEDGLYVCELPVVNGEKISSSALAKLVDRTNSLSPFDAFGEWIDNEYTCAEADVFDKIIQFAKGRLIDESGELTVEQEDWLEDFVRDNVVFYVPEDHFLSQHVHVPIFIDTGDANYDFTLNCIGPHYGSNKDPNEEIDPKSSIRWLAEQQGYSEETLRNFIYSVGHLDENLKEDDFLSSVYNELANTPSLVAALVVLTDMTVENYLKLNTVINENRAGNYWNWDPTERPDCGYIYLNKNAYIGLYNAWDGGGGMFDICLEKDIKLPVNFIYSALPDVRVSRNLGFGPYSIDEVYGFTDEVWKDVVSFAPPYRKKEDLER